MRFDFTTDEELHQSATLGLIVLKADETVELDFRRLLPDENLAVHVSRVESGDELTLESIAAMKERIAASAALFPSTSRFDAVGYACTSATSVIGPQAVADMIAESCETASVTEPVSALLAACHALSVRRLAFLSPYVESVSSHLRSVVEKDGITISTFGSFEEASEAKVVRISPQSIIDAATTLAHQSPTDAIFLSCTNLRALDLIAPLEQELGIPVLSSNQVLAWHMARLAGLTVQHVTFGKIWQV